MVPHSRQTSAGPDRFPPTQARAKAAALKVPNAAAVDLHQWCDARMADADNATSPEGGLAYASSVKRQLSEMRETLGMRQVPDTANENNAAMEKKPTEPKGPLAINPIRAIKFGGFGGVTSNSGFGTCPKGRLVQFDLPGAGRCD